MTGKVRDNNRLSVFSLRIYNLSCIMCFVDSFDCDDGTVRSDAKIESFTQEGDAGLICDETFIDAVLSGDRSKIRSDYADAVKSLAFALACSESMETHQPVKVRWDI